MQDTTTPTTQEEQATKQRRWRGGYKDALLAFFEGGEKRVDKMIEEGAIAKKALYDAIWRMESEGRPVPVAFRRIAEKYNASGNFKRAPSTGQNRAYRVSRGYVKIPVSSIGVSDGDLVIADFGRSTISISSIAKKRIRSGQLPLESN